MKRKDYLKHLGLTTLGLSTAVPSFANKIMYQDKLIIDTDDLQSQINELKNSTVNYNRDSDYIEVVQNGITKKVFKVGFSETYLLKDGVIPDEILSLWKNSNAKVTPKSGYLEIQPIGGNDQSLGYGMYACKIDITNYSTVEITASQTYGPPTNVYCRYGVFSSLGANSSPVVGTYPNTSLTKSAYDISTLEGEYFIGLNLAQGSSANKGFLATILLK